MYYCKTPIICMLDIFALFVSSKKTRKLQALEKWEVSYMYQSVWRLTWKLQAREFSGWTIPRKFHTANYSCFTVYYNKLLWPNWIYKHTYSGSLFSHLPYCMFWSARWFELRFSIYDINNKKMYFTLLTFEIRVLCFKSWLLTLKVLNFWTFT